jgi:hypothetical protein
MLRMTDTMTSQNIGLSSLDILYTDPDKFRGLKLKQIKFSK